MSKIVVTELSKYRHEPRYKVLLQNSQQFKSQARKMTHAVFKKEMQSVRGDWSELEVGAEVGKKTRSFVLKQLEHVARKTERRRAKQSSDMIALYMQRMPERGVGLCAPAASDSRSPTDSQTDSASACASGLGGPASDSLFGASASCVGCAPAGAPDSSPGAHTELSAHGSGEGEDDEAQAAASLLVLSTAVMSPKPGETISEAHPQPMDTSDATATLPENSTPDAHEIVSKSPS